MPLCDAATRVLDSIGRADTTAPSIRNVLEQAQMAKKRFDQAQLVLIAVSMYTEKLGRLVIVPNCSQITVKPDSGAKGVRCSKRTLNTALGNMGWDESVTDRVHEILFGLPKQHKPSNGDSRRSKRAGIL